MDPFIIALRDPGYCMCSGHSEQFRGEPAVAIVTPNFTNAGFLGRQRQANQAQR